jgi:pimeloyl-ACP methyl ester carboxylesterase
MTHGKSTGPAGLGVVAALFAATWLSACGGDSSGPPPAPAPTPVAAVPLTCDQVDGMTGAAAAIGLPTTGATAVGSYCLVTGTIAPVDSTAPNIVFNLALPSTWNQKIMMFGGGGTDGSVPAVTGTTPQADATTASPLGRGYAVFASDSGHQDANSADSSWSVNQEANLNFMGDALKKTHDVALSLIDSFYAVSAPKQAYFAGGSTGGREALTVAQRWPADWNGVIAFYPAWDYTALTLGQLNAAQAFAAPGAWMDTAKRGVLFNAALAACDALDGVADGVISNVKACLATFNPATAMLNGTAVRCVGGADTGDTCLSDAQIAAVTSMDSPVPFNTTLASGESSYPGYNAFIADLGIPSASPYEGIISELAIGSVAPAFPVTTSMMFDAQISGSWIQYTVVGDPTYDPLTFPISLPSAFTSQLSYLSSLDAIDTNLTPFASKGGKLLIMHGTADVTVSPRATENYFAKMQASMGVDVVAGFTRFYEVPGFQHAFSTVFNPSWDNLTELEQWVENGTAPSNEVVTDTLGVPGRTRPLCVYPTWPKYSGSGDVNVAASYTCSN